VAADAEAAINLRLVILDLRFISFFFIIRVLSRVVFYQIFLVPTKSVFGVGRSGFERTQRKARRRNRPNQEKSLNRVTKMGEPFFIRTWFKCGCGAEEAQYGDWHYRYLATKPVNITRKDGFGIPMEGFVFDLCSFSDGPSAV
jgi:hypothetical protein